MPYILRMARRGKPEIPQRQLEFVAQLLLLGGEKYGNGRAAAIAAGYSPRTADVTAAQLLANPKIQAIIAKRQQTLAIRADVTLDKVVRELASVGLSDIRLLLDPQTGDILPPSQWPDLAAASVASYEIEERPKGKTVKVRLWPKVGALQELRAYFTPPKGARGGMRLPDGTMVGIEWGDVGEMGSSELAETLALLAELAGEAIDAGDDDGLPVVDAEIVEAVEAVEAGEDVREGGK